MKLGARRVRRARRIRWSSSASRPTTTVADRTVLGRMAPPPDPLAQATFALRTIRGGGAEFDPKRLIISLETAGCTAVRVLPRQGPAPLEYVIGQRAESVTR